MLLFLEIRFLFIIDFIISRNDVVLSGVSLQELPLRFQRDPDIPILHVEVRQWLIAYDIIVIS